MTASAVSSSSVLAPTQSQPKPASRPTNAAAAFQQSLNKYLQSATSGAGGATGANPTQTLSSSLMSSLLQMQG